MNTGQNYTQLVPGSGAAVAISCGSFTYIFFRSAPFPFQFSFDGTSFYDGWEGQNLGPLQTAASHVFLQIPPGTSQAVTVEFYATNYPSLSGPDVMQFKPAATFAVGNMGFGSQADINALNGQYISDDGIVAGGQGYAAGQFLTVAGGVGAAARFRVANINRQGTILALFPASRPLGNYTALPPTPNTPTGGTGSGAQLSLVFANFSNAIFTWANGYLSITNASAWTVPNINQGAARKSITFSVSATSASALRVLDSNGNTLMDIPAAAKQTIETTDLLQVICPDANLSTFTTAELYYN